MNKWVGRCPECGTWGTVDEAAPIKVVGGRSHLLPNCVAVPMSSIPPDTTRHDPTGVDELDRVLGGGVVPGSVTLLAGEPGVGKSTLLLKVVHQWACAGAQGTVCLRRGVDRPDQDARRAHRLQPRRGVPGRRLGSGQRAGAHRGGASHAGGGGLGADDVDHGRRRSHGRCHAGPGRHHDVDHGGEAKRCRDDPGRSRHQGRRDRGSADTGTSGGRGVALRRRPAVDAADGSRGQEPLRRSRRGGLLPAP